MADCEIVTTSNVLICPAGGQISDNSQETAYSFDTVKGWRSEASKTENHHWFQRSEREKTPLKYKQRSSGKLKLLAVYISNNWPPIPPTQKLYFLKKLKLAQLPQGLLVQFYGNIERIFTNTGSQLHICWKERPASFPDFGTIYASQVRKTASSSIFKDTALPGHYLFKPLPSGRWFRAFKAHDNSRKSTVFLRVSPPSHSSLPPCQRTDFKD